MPLDATGKMQDREVVSPERIRYQSRSPGVSPTASRRSPVPYRLVYLTNTGRKGEQVECVECTACTLIRDGGPACGALSNGTICRRPRG